MSANNRRLWVFKALESLGQCDKISVIVTNRISNKENVVQKDVKVRGDPGGFIYKFKIKHQMTVQYVLLAMAMLCLDTK